MICFKYGKQFYRLSQDTRVWFRTGRLSQSRIAMVLNIHRKSLKIISKGKVIYPDHTKSEEELSQTILTISALDKSKPSLVVMGTRCGVGIAKQSPIPVCRGSTHLDGSRCVRGLLSKPSMDVSCHITTCSSSISATIIKSSRLEKRSHAHMFHCWLDE
jgi:hypothetical protein